MICPFMLDQPHNAKTIEKLGCSPGSVPFNTSITAAKVSKLVQQVLGDDAKASALRTRAAEIGRQVSRESSSSLSKYCVAIEEYTQRKLPHV